MSVAVVMCCYWFNFFYLDDDVDKCARMHGDSHIRKMILECAQIVSYAIRNVEPTVQWAETDVYSTKGPHAKHPVVLWAQSCREAMLWVIDLGFALERECKRRKAANPVLCKGWSSKPHASTHVLAFVRDHIPACIVPASSSDKLEPPSCVPDCYKRPEWSVMERYRMYYAAHKVDFTGLRWLPLVEEPFFLDEYKKRARQDPEIQHAIARDQMKKKWEDEKDTSRDDMITYLQTLHAEEHHSFIVEMVMSIKKRKVA